MRLSTSSSSYSNTDKDNDDKRFHLALKILLLYIPILVLGYFIYNLVDLYFAGNDLHQLLAANILVFNVLAMYGSGSMTIWLLLMHIEFSRNVKSFLLFCVVTFQLSTVAVVAMYSF